MPIAAFKATAFKVHSKRDAWEETVSPNSRLNEAGAPDAHRDERPLFLVITIWAGGTLGLLVAGLDAKGHEWEDLPRWAGSMLKALSDIHPITSSEFAYNFLWLIALGAMFYLGCLAYLSVTERGRDKRLRKHATRSMVIGTLASLAIADGYAAFPMFLLLGFPLDFWGVAKH